MFKQHVCSSKIKREWYNYYFKVVTFTVELSLAPFQQAFVGIHFPPREGSENPYPLVLRVVLNSLKLHF